ncbi:PREDICTED: uncharacterized protein LOC106126172 isoform X1 [Papilio xuthus]|uniref:Uncharacterized protein LOC106126172 isoform X1 n=1 Tax=Papilio xuthus TaxID=66420 RepID=A0AAJ6ZTW3_PAPXU|nr:PREDICTED: uncharacterized protein LOC106126172 isoform X1 [Papilio xuthus]
MSDRLKLTKDKHHKSTSSLAGVLLDGSLSERKLLVKATNHEDKFQFAETRCTELQEKLSDLINNSKRRKNLKKRSATGLNTMGKMSEFNSDYVTIRKKNPKRQCKEETFCEWDNEFAQTGNNVSTGMNPVGKTSEGNADYVTIKKKNPKRQCKEETTYCEWDNDFAQTGNNMSPVHEANGVRGDGENHASKSSRHSVTYKTRRRPSDVTENPKRPVVELFNINRSESSGDTWQENYAGSQRKHSGGGYAVVRGTAPAPVAESYTESGDESKRSKKIRKVMKFMVRRRYELPTVSSRSKQRSTKAYEPSTNKAHIPFVTSKSATPSHNVGLNIQQVLHGLKINQPISEIPSTMAHHMGLRHCTSDAGVKDEVQVKELNMLKLGKITVTLPKYKSMSFDQLLRLYESNNVIVGKFLKTASCRKRRPSLKRINPSKALTFKCHTEDSDDLIDQQSFSSRPPR